MTEQAYTLTRGADQTAPILFASPHSGSVYPEILRQNLRVPLIDLQRTEDAFVDELIENVPDQGAALLTAHYARAYVDLNRDPGEIDTGMIEGRVKRPLMRHSARVEAGLGCLPKIGASGEVFYADRISAADAEHRLTHVHDSYHAALHCELIDLRQTWGQAFLIDCHSMPSCQPGRRELPDIILGDRFGKSCTAHLTRTAERAFKALGYTVARNAPYAGGYTTVRYGRPIAHIHALQIELNRNLYMDEGRVEKSDGFARLQSDMTCIGEELTELARALAGPALAAE